MTSKRWQYLEQRSHPWRKQFYFKGRRLRPFTVWMTIQVENMTAEDAAINWNLPIEAVNEAIKYCQTHQELLKREADEERRRLENKGYTVAPQITNG